jgi:hypothetical protein
MSYRGTSKYIGKFKAGQRIARWTIVNGDIILQREAMIEAICECGNKRLVSAYTLTKGTSTGCKVCQNQNMDGMNNGNWKGGKFIGSSLFTRIKRQAKEREISFAITMKDIEKLYEKQTGKCALTGLPVSFTDNTASLDRIDSNKGYTTDNIQWVHKDINRMKNEYDMDYFVKMCSLIVENYKRETIYE